MCKANKVSKIQILVFKNQYIARLLIIASVLFACNRPSFKEQINNYPEVKVDENWKLRLPYNLKEKRELKEEYYYKYAFVSPSDSIIFKLTPHIFSIEDGVNNFKNVVENEKEFAERINLYYNNRSGEFNGIYQEQRKKYAQKFTIERMEKEIYSLYKTLNI